LLPSDHIIGNADLYEESMQEAIEKAKNGFIVTFGIAYKPETGYGYIERDGDNVLSFRENQIKFQRDFIAKGNFME
jgi:mannose-1-phosphate guanylyltransferase